MPDLTLDDCLGTTTLIVGPHASGKTTTTDRLAEEARDRGLHVAETHGAPSPSYLKLLGATLQDFPTDPAAAVGIIVMDDLDEKRRQTADLEASAILTSIITDGYRHGFGLLATSKSDDLAPLFDRVYEL